MTLNPGDQQDNPEIEAMLVRFQEQLDIIKDNMGKAMKGNVSAATKLSSAATEIEKLVNTIKPRMAEMSKAQQERFTMMSESFAAECEAMVGK